MGFISFMIEVFRRAGKRRRRREGGLRDDGGEIGAIVVISFGFLGIFYKL